MATNSSKTKAARRAAREKVEAAQANLVRRAQQNTEDLATFFSAMERAAAIDRGLAQRIAALKSDAEKRLTEQRRVGGAALAAMRDRGESFRDICALAGIGEKSVRELIGLADNGPAVADGTP